jgi:dUTP pyrophosphatase
MEEPVRIAIRYLKHHEGLPAVRRQTPGSSGFDIHAACADRIVVAPGAAALVPAGFELSMPETYDRSGLALKHRVGLLNSPGTVDSDYRGEICVILYNFGDEDFVVRRGDRIAQLVFSRAPRVELVESEALDETERGPGGFGHTG